MITNETQDRELFVKLSKKYNTPYKVQQLLRSMEYNGEEDGETVRSAYEAYQVDRAHCLEASMLSAAILEHHGYAPLVLNLDSADNLNHSLFVFKERTGWGAISKSREEGLHGRAPIFRSMRELAWSYYDPYIDDSGRLVGYEIANLEDSGVDWRWSTKNLWKVEELVTTLKFKKMQSSEERFQRLFERYRDHGPVPAEKHWW